jgi:hypothetical protein
MHEPWDPGWLAGLMAPLPTTVGRTVVTQSAGTATSVPTCPIGAGRQASA